MTDFEKMAREGALFDGHYKLIHPLSVDGATADVWLAMDVNTIDAGIGEDEKPGEESGMLVAIKIYRPKNALDIEGEQRFRDEYKVVYECRHANLLQPTSFSICGEYPYLVLPYCRYGSSEKLIGKSLPVSEMWKYILDVTSGLARLHSNNPQIIHQDIKPANILIDNSRNYAITDFGISAKKGGVHGFYFDDENSGTLAYMAPERFTPGVDPMPQSDIWAFGATLCEVLTGKVPFGEAGGQTQRDGAVFSLPLTGIPSDIQRIIHACLEKEPGNRPTAQQLAEAARARQFPIRRRWPLPLALSLLVIGAVAAVLLLRPQTPVPTQEESFDQAVSYMRSADPALFMEGYHLMDTLSKQEYIPAMYEMAFTHGWFSDTASLRRKRMLGITTNDENLSTSDADNQRVVVWLGSILEKGDSLYPAINAEAAYRLAGYYINGTSNFSINYQKGWDLLQQSKSWAQLAGNTALLRKIEDGITQLSNYLNESE